MAQDATSPQWPGGAYEEFAVPARYVPPPEATMADDIFNLAARHPHHVGFGRRRDGTWMPVTSKRFADEVVAVAAGLMAAGVQSGDRVALFSRTRYEWMLSDFAIWTAGAVTVPIYETSSAEQVEWILLDSGAVAAVVETPQLAALVEEVRPRLSTLREIWTIEPDGIKALTARGRTIDVEDVARRRAATSGSDLATIVYTSGTTGRPKGCAITHANLLSEVHNVALAPGVGENVINETKATLLFLPLAHILARTIQLAAVHTGTYLGHTGDIKTVAAQLQEFRPTSVLSVPRIFEKIYNTAQHKAVAQGHGKIFAWAEDVAIAYSQALDAGGPVLALRLRHAVADRLVYAKIRAAMGGRADYAVSGGAPLGARLGHFFRGVGVTVLEGYGLTETCAGSTLNLPGAQKIGSVGKPLPGCTVHIAPDGEVLLKGGNVFVGYWQDETATKEVFDEQGWFHTGDLGELDAQGFLTITGRKKDLIVTASGKNVAPAVLEDRLRAHWLVSQCVVVGDAQPFIAALITVDPESFEQWKADAGKPAEAGVDALKKDPDLLAALQSAVDDANKAVSAAEAIKRFTVLAHDFTVEGGELTPTLKVKRALVLDTHANDVAALYTRP